jgi:hypothetical protein
MLEQVLLELIENNKTCHIFMWREEPSRFSWCKILAQDDEVGLISVFEPSGNFIGIRHIPLEHIHLVKVPLLEKDMESDHFLLVGQLEEIKSKTFDSEQWLQARVGSVVELFTEFADSHLGYIKRVDEDCILLDYIDPLTLKVDSTALFNRADVRYCWFFSERIQALESLIRPRSDR